MGEKSLYKFVKFVKFEKLLYCVGFPGKHYCPRMATMNKPTFQAIKQHSPDKPVLVFVSSRRQTRLTALDLIGFLAAEENPRQFVRLSEDQLEQLTLGVRDPNLKLTLSFGVGIHHAGLTDRDRRLVEDLFVNQKIQILIATATLAWGVNFPAHLVVIKGTEYYDGKTHRYMDMPITDVLQMMGRAGRPQYDDHGVACVLVHDIKKDFYKKFLYEPFPVESSLLQVLPDHLNAEIVAGTIASKQDCVDYLTWTYFFRRLLQNPAYYGLEQLEPSQVNKYLSDLVDRSLGVLESACCLQITDSKSVEPTSLGRIASYYYLSYVTLDMLRKQLEPTSDLEHLLKVLSDCHEFSQLPVRHNEDLLNGQLAADCRWPVNQNSLDSSHTKTLLLLQAHFSRLALPCADYSTDTKSVLDQSIRILQAMIDVAAESGFLATTLRIEQLMQMVVQAVWVGDPPVSILPHVDPAWLLNDCQLFTLMADGRVAGSASLDPQQKREVEAVLQMLPRIDVELSVVCEEVSNPVDSAAWLQIGCGAECILSVTIHWRNHSAAAAAGASSTGGARPKNALRTAPSSAGPARNAMAYAPHFPKGKDQSYFLTLGSVESGELLALKRAPLSRAKACHQLAFTAPQRPGRIVLDLYVMADCYVGLDQQYRVQLEVF